MEFLATFSHSNVHKRVSAPMREAAIHGAARLLAASAAIPVGAD